MSRSHLINGLLILAVGFITIHYRYIDGLLFPINDHDTHAGNRDGAAL